MPNEQRPLKVFLCHAHSDAVAVRALYIRLKREGLDVWLDKENLLPGQNWKNEIRKAVLDADVIIVCHTREFNQAGFRQREVKWALDAAMEQPEGEIFIIPARLEVCDVLESLGDRHWVDLFEDDGYEMLMRALRARATKIGAALHAGRSWLPKVTTPRKGEKLTPDRLAAELKPASVKIEAKGGAAKGLGIEKAKPPKRKLNTMIIVVLIALVVTIIGALLSLPALAPWWQRTLKSAASPTLASISMTVTTSPLPIAPRDPIPTSTDTLQLTSDSASSPSTTAIATPSLSTETISLPEYGIGYMSAADDYDRSLDLYTADLSGDPRPTVEDFGLLSDSFAVSQNGQYVALSKDETIYYLDVLTGEKGPLIISFYQRDYENLAWSQNGRYLFATVDGWNETWESGQLHYSHWLKKYVITTANQTPTEISNVAGYHQIKNPRWSPDNTIVAYWESGDIFVATPGSKSSRNITRSGVVSEIPFDWSPDGKQVLFTKTTDGLIYLLDVETGKEVSTIDPIHGDPRDIHWSHDGKKVCFSVSNKIYVYDFLTQKVGFVVDGWNPVWSPDDTKLLFLSDRDVFVVNIDGTEKTNISKSPTVTEFNPFWIDLSALFELKPDDTPSGTS